MSTKWNRNNTELSSLLTHFFHAISVPTAILQGGKIVFSMAATAFDPEPSFALMAAHIHPDETRIQMFARLHFLCGFIPIPGFDGGVLVGPVCERRPANEEYLELMNLMRMDAGRLAELKYRFEKAPLFSSARFQAVLRFLDYLINDRDAPLESVDPVPVKESVLQKKQLPDSTYHASYKVEQLLLEMIMKGDPEGLKSHLLNVVTSGAETSNFDVDPLTQGRILFTSSVALCARAAIKGGMDYELALSISDDYIKRIYKISESYEILPLLGIMMLEYAEHVSAVRFPNTSPITRAALREIDAHVGELIRIDELAVTLSVSESRLSHCFRQEMGVSLKTWILMRKTEEAKKLLKQGFSVEAAADALSFSSPTHLSTTFRKITGLSPREYIRKH